jgi:hypothetical protein
MEASGKLQAPVVLPLGKIAVSTGWAPQTILKLYKACGLGYKQPTLLSAGTTSLNKSQIILDTFGLKMHYCNFVVIADVIRLFNSSVNEPSYHIIR